MMRPQKTVVVATLLLVATLLMWWWLSQKAVLNNTASSVRTSSSLPSAGAGPIIPASSVLSPAATPLDTSLEPQQQKFIEAFNTPITFFGQVADQNGAPVVGADVQIAANDNAFGGKPAQHTLKTDGTGRFSIAGLKGITLAVEVSKPGYRIIPPADNRVTSSGVFSYALSSSRGKFQPDPDNPVRFVLYRIQSNEPLYKVASKDYPIAKDGSPLVISLDPAGSHRVVLQCWSNTVKSQRQYDWRVEIAPIKGGLLTKGEMSFEAPAGGYVSKDSIEMPASLPREQWDSSVEKSYFLRFDDGLFGSAKMQIHSTGDHFVTWESLLNPKPGSRNLETEQ